MGAASVFSARFIPTMEFERQLVAASNLTLDHVRLGVAFIGAILSGLSIRFIPSPKGRNLFSAVSGLLLLLYPFGGQVIHGVIAALFTYLLMWYSPKKCGTLTWSIVFPYLVAFHIMNASGLSGVTGPITFTGGQMLLTLKLISMAVCYQDAQTKNAKGLSEYQKTHVFHKLPNILALLGFAFAFGNLLGGPIIEFRDYQMWVNREGPWAKNAQKRLQRQQWRGDLRAALGALWTAAWSLVIYLTAGRAWNPSLLLTHWYHSQPLMAKLMTMQVIAVVVRCTAYYQWSLCHCSLALSGLDLKGWAPDPDDSSGKPAKGVWGRCKNGSTLKLELCHSSRLLPRYWNTTTANFLRRYVYERLTAPGRKPTFRTLLATELVCAIWHGVYPGYIMFFAGGAVMFAHSTVLYKYEHTYLPQWLTNSWPWWAVRVCLTKLCIDFLIMAYALRSWRACIAVWASVHYLPLIFMSAVFLLGSIFPVHTLSEVVQTAQQQKPAGPMYGSDSEAHCAAPAAGWGPVLSTRRVHVRREEPKSAAAPSRPGSRLDHGPVGQACGNLRQE